MKLFIWKGKGISSAYHDDGTLVVLANDAQEARKVVLADRAERKRQQKSRDRELEDAANLAGFEGRDAPYLWRRSGEAAMVKTVNEIDEKYPLVHDYGDWDGSEAALSRDPDEFLEIDTPKIVAFNGGGYD